MIDTETAMPAVGVVVFVKRHSGDMPFFDFATWDGERWRQVDIDTGGVVVDSYIAVAAWEPSPWAEQKCGKVL